MMLVSPFTFPASLYGLLGECNLLDELVLCLDAGDKNSFESGQVWYDRSGEENHYYRGSNGSTQSTDPTFNGTAGNLSPSEYWSFDGADYFRETSNQSFADTWAKEGLTTGFTFLVLIWPPSGGFTAQNDIFENGENPFFNTVVSLHALAAETLRLTVGNNSATTTATLTAAAWNFGLFSVIGTNGQTGSFHRVNTTVAAFTIDAAQNFGQSGSPYYISPPTDELQNTVRIAGFVAWARPLSESEADALYKAIKSRRLPSLA